MRSSQNAAIDHPWIRATPKGSAVTAGYLTVSNHGKAADRLIGASLQGAGSAELHETTIENGIARMRPLRDGDRDRCGPDCFARAQRTPYHVLRSHDVIRGGHLRGRYLDVREGGQGAGGVFCRGGDRQAASFGAGRSRNGTDREATSTISTESGLYLSVP